MFLESTEFEMMNNGPSKLHVSSIIPSIGLFRVYYEDSQVGF